LVDVAAVAEFGLVEIAALLPLRLRYLSQPLLQPRPDLLADRIVRRRQADAERLDLLDHGDDHLAMHTLMLAHAVDERLPVPRDRIRQFFGGFRQVVADDEFGPRRDERAGAVRLRPVVALPGELEVGEGDRPADAGLGSAFADRGIEIGTGLSRDSIENVLLDRLPLRMGGDRKRDEAGCKQAGADGKGHALFRPREGEPEAAADQEAAADAR